MLVSQNGATIPHLWDIFDEQKRAGEPFSIQRGITNDWPLASCTLPKTNIAGWKIHRILMVWKQGSSWGWNHGLWLLVSGRHRSFLMELHGVSPGHVRACHQTRRCIRFFLDLEAPETGGYESLKNSRSTTLLVSFSPTICFNSWVCFDTLGKKHQVVGKKGCSMATPEKMTNFWFTTSEANLFEWGLEFTGINHHILRWPKGGTPNHRNETHRPIGI